MNKLSQLNSHSIILIKIQIFFICFSKLHMVYRASIDVISDIINISIKTLF